MSDGNPYAPFDLDDMTPLEREQFQRAARQILDRVAKDGPANWQRYQNALLARDMNQDMPPLWSHVFAIDPTKPFHWTAVEVWGQPTSVEVKLAPETWEKPAISDEVALKARLALELPTKQEAGFGFAEEFLPPAEQRQQQAQGWDDAAEAARNMNVVVHDPNNPANRQRSRGPREPWRPDRSAEVSPAKLSFGSHNARSIEFFRGDEEKALLNERHVVVVARHDHIERLKTGDIVKAFVQNNWSEFRVHAIQPHAADLLRIIILVSRA